MTTRRFETTAERNAWIAEHFPERKATEVPGGYVVDGGMLGVYLDEVTFYPNSQHTPETWTEADEWYCVRCSITGATEIEVVSKHDHLPTAR